MQMMRIAAYLKPLALALGLALPLAPAGAQSSASTYSFGTYNPVQAAINRNSMNAAILRQATHGKYRNIVSRHRSPHRRR